MLHTEYSRKNCENKETIFYNFDFIFDTRITLSQIFSDFFDPKDKISIQEPF